TPVLRHRQPQPVHFVQDEMKRADRTGLYAGEAMVEIETAGLDQFARRPRLLNALVGQVGVPPAGKAILPVPLRLAVPQQDERRHQASTFSLLARSVCAAFRSGRMAWSESRQATARYFDLSSDQ